MHVARLSSLRTSGTLNTVHDSLKRPFLRFALRDALLTATTFALAFLDRTSDSLVVAVLTGVLVPVLGFLLHEWGHLLGTWMSGGIAHAPSSLMTFFLFYFDVEKSTRRQFLAMSFGGYLATFFVVLGLIAWIDLSRWSGMIALVLSVLGIGVTVALELPTTWKVWRGERLPTGGVYIGEPGSEGR